MLRGGSTTTSVVTTQFFFFSEQTPPDRSFSAAVNHLGKKPRHTAGLTAVNHHHKTRSVDRNTKIEFVVVKAVECFQYSHILQLETSSMERETKGETESETKGQRETRRPET